MKIVDTHAHLYLEEFQQDRDEVIQRAIDKGVQTMLLPNIDAGTVEDMLTLHKRFPKYCLPMMGLHPTSVKKETFEDELLLVKQQVLTNTYFGIGEIGIDLYWDKKYEEQQREAFRYQLGLAKKYKLPVSIHVRNAFEIALTIVKQELDDDLKGVFHCFTGTLKEAYQIMDMGLLLGIGGIVTFKKAGLAETIRNISTDYLVLETDAPYLTPVPFRGKRNESSYLYYILEKIASVQSVSMEEIAEKTTFNATTLFNIML